MMTITVNKIKTTSIIIMVFILLLLGDGFGRTMVVLLVVVSMVSIGNVVGIGPPKDK